MRKKEDTAGKTTQPGDEEREWKTERGSAVRSGVGKNEGDSPHGIGTGAMYGAAARHGFKIAVKGFRLDKDEEF